MGEGREKRGGGRGEIEQEKERGYERQDMRKMERQTSGRKKEKPTTWVCCEVGEVCFYTEICT